jgi:hypothetical protein
MSRSAGPAATVAAASGWVGLILLLCWQEFFVESKWATVWWFRVPATLAFGLVILVFAIECLVAEMTVRRWATSVLVFGIFGVLLLIAGIFRPDTLQMHRGVLIPVALFYLAAAGLAASGAKDSL